MNFAVYELIRELTYISSPFLCLNFIRKLNAYPVQLPFISMCHSLYRYVCERIRYCSWLSKIFGASWPFSCPELVLLHRLPDLPSCTPCTRQNVNRSRVESLYWRQGQSFEPCWMCRSLPWSVSFRGSGGKHRLKKFFCYSGAVLIAKCRESEAVWCRIHLVFFLH